KAGIATNVEDGLSLQTLWNDRLEKSQSACGIVRVGRIAHHTWRKYNVVVPGPQFLNYSQDFGASRRIAFFDTLPHRSNMRAELTQHSALVEFIGPQRLAVVLRKSFFRPDSLRHLKQALGFVMLVQHSVRGRSIG